MVYVFNELSSADQLIIKDCRIHYSAYYLWVLAELARVGVLYEGQPGFDIVISLSNVTHLPNTSESKMYPIKIFNNTTDEFLGLVITVHESLGSQPPTTLVTLPRLLYWA